MFPVNGCLADPPRLQKKRRKKESQQAGSTGVCRSTFRHNYANILVFLLSSSSFFLLSPFSTFLFFFFFVPAWRVNTVTSFFFANRRLLRKNPADRALEARPGIREKEELVRGGWQKE